MARGRVKWFSPEKGFGFIALDTDQDTEVFVHYTSVLGNGFRMLHKDEVVEFDLIDTQKGFQARNVKRLGFDGSADSAADSPEDSSDS
jgi:CspA family cold shock protein